MHTNSIHSWPSHYRLHSCDVKIEYSYMLIPFASWKPYRSNAPTVGDNIMQQKGPRQLALGRELKAQKKAKAGQYARKFLTTPTKWLNHASS